MPTKIPWVINSDGTPGQVLNVVTGCTPISEGCANCYAKRLATGRLAGRFGYPKNDPFQVILHPERMIIAMDNNKPTTYLVCSMGDIFHKDVPEKYILDVIEMMVSSPQHTFLVLTKRPGRLLSSPELRRVASRLPLSANIWVGVSVENQKTACERIGILEQIPAAGRFVSIEPMLGPISFRWAKWAPFNRYKNNHLDGLRLLDLVICGGENGPGARPMHPDWVRSIRDQCIAAGVPFFFKCWGEWFPVTSLFPVANNGRDFDTQGKDLESFYGCKVMGIKQNGTTFFPDPFKNIGEEINPWWMAKVGSKASGHKLDGKEHRQVPWEVK